ncbi:MAG: hypothetical protein ABI821_18265 [Pseudomonadota bacterium]
MHPNYHETFVRTAAAALPHARMRAPSILANRRSVTACALRSERDFGDLS